MLEYAEQEYALSQSKGDSTIREQLELVWKNTGRKPPELENIVECPKGLFYLWVWFNRIEQSRTYGGMQGINPIQYSEIKAFFELIEVDPMEWEIIVIKQLDSIAMKAYNESLKKSTPSKKPKK